MSGSEERLPLYKIVLAGDVGVGKTSIFQRYDKNKFFDHKESTFGLDKLNKNVEVDGQKCKINVWDTAGMERTRSLTSNYYRNSHAVIFVYAIDDMYSLTVLRNWIDDVNKDATKALKFLVGNKIDLVDEGSQVDKELAENFRKNNDLHSLFHVSAKTGDGIVKMFEDIAELLVRSTKATIQDRNAFAVIQAESEKASKDKRKQNSGCCG